MKRSFSLISNPCTYEAHIGTSLYGQLYIQSDDFIFPFNDWGDLIAAVLVMWKNNLNILQSFSVSDPVKFSFMDGSYYFTATKITADALRLEFYGNEKLVNVIEDVDYKCFLDQILSTAQKILLFLEENLEYPCAREIDKLR